MHSTIIDFFQRMKKQYPDVFIEKRILECGSMEISGGTIRPFFDKAEEYIGIDWRKGKCVDVVSLIHEYRGKPDGYFDVVVSTQTLEHDPYWPNSVKRMVELTRVGGALILTYSGGQGAHLLDTSPEEGYYEDRNVFEVMEVINSLARFEVIHTEEADGDCRIFLRGKK